MSENADSAVGIFREAAGGYDAVRRRVVPCFDPFYGHVLRMLLGEPRRVLDLGAGTGLLSRMVADTHPEARLVLVDGAAEMLEHAERALGDRIEATHVQDLADPLPDGPFDAVVSAFAIHHLEDPAKADLYARAFEVLAPGAPLVNGEQVAGPTPELDALYRRWHEEDARALGSDDAEWEATIERMRLDLSAPVETQLDWMRDAGFVDVDCPWRSGRFAVLYGRRPDA
jgi:tRNA (cmo5U34)-methyltransferase